MLSGLLLKATGPVALAFFADQRFRGCRNEPRLLFLFAAALARRLTTFPWRLVVRSEERRPPTVLVALPFNTEAREPMLPREAELERDDFLLGMIVTKLNK